MTGPWQYALTVGPLGFYLWVLAVWQGARHPRVVRGSVDFGLLAFGLGGLLAFGPFGQLLARMISPRPDVFDRLVVVSVLGLWAMYLGRKSSRRLVVYHIDADAIRPALDEVLSRNQGRFVKTMAGYEDVSMPRGLRIESTRWLRCAVVEAHGVDAEALIRDIHPFLEKRLRGETSPSSSIALTLYACSIVVMLVPLVDLLLSQPRARETLRVLLERLRGG